MPLINTLSAKTQIGILVGVFITGILIGGLFHSSATTTTKQEAKADVKADKDIHEHKVTIITKAPDGTSTTKIDSSTDTIARSDIESDTTSTVVVSNKSLNVSALVGASIHDPLIPIYGVSITKQVFSNLNVGGFALTNGIIGVSIGLSF